MPGTDTPRLFQGAFRQLNKFFVVISVNLYLTRGHYISVEIHSYPRTHLMDDMCSPTRIKNIIKKYPKLRMSIAHIGGFQYEELTDLGLFFNISAILPDLVDKYGIAGTNKILRRLDVEKLVFATDYPDNRKLEPIEIYDKYFEILSQMDFSEEEAEKICRLNALKMINK